MHEDSIRKFLSNIQCGRCGQQCIPSNIELLEHRGDLWFFSVYCHSCKSLGFLAAVIRENEGSQVINELTETEMNRFSTPISSDDVLDMYIFLKDFGGDFSGLFPQESSGGE